MMKFLLVLIILIICFRLARRFIFINTVRGFQKAADEFRKQQESAQQKPEGSVTIENPGKGNGRASATEGEYIDYEEIR